MLQQVREPDIAPGEGGREKSGLFPLPRLPTPRLRRSSSSCALVAYVNRWVRNARARTQASPPGRASVLEWPPLTLPPPLPMFRDGNSVRPILRPSCSGPSSGAGSVSRWSRRSLSTASRYGKAVYKLSKVLFVGPEELRGFPFVCSAVPTCPEVKSHRAEGDPLSFAPGPNSAYRIAAALQDLAVRARCAAESAERGLDR